MITQTKPNNTPNFTGQAASACELIDVYRNHPEYQQNNHLGWMTRANLESICMDERLNQMPGDLTSAGIYIKMTR